MKPLFNIAVFFVYICKMITINDYIKKCNFVINNLLDEQERIVLNNENKIIGLNVDTFQSGYGSDGRILNNKNEKVKGVYSLGTQLINPSKTSGNPYTFFDSGDFISNLQIDFEPSLVKFNIFSTGTGSGDKSIFFAGYTNLFGLDKDNNYIVNYEIIYPQLMQFVKKYL